MSTCPRCDQPGIFGYRDNNTGEMTWYCTTHRLSQDWADARRDQSTSPRPDHPSSASPICNLINAPMTDPHLATLNPEQRHAVEHGVRPLLINAGAGSGKTKTLVHRVAHLIVGGVDPRRIMLLTFSRRAAEEMIRRVQRIASQVLPKQARLMVDALTWSAKLKLDTWTAINEQSKNHLRA
jgi:superfamily I DNA and RNA helicase